MSQQEIHIRTALMPLCYKDFHCLAAACRDNCCGGWEIAFNKRDYLKIKRSARSPELQAILAEGMERLRDKGTERTYAHFSLNAERVCAFQTEEGLCRLQQECGAEALPVVCRDYPRKVFYTVAAKEFALSPSCEGVLALLWDLPQGIDFLEEDLPRQDWRLAKTVTGYSAWFPQIRSLCVDALQERSLPLPRRLLLLGLLLRRLRDADWEREDTVEAWLDWGARQLHDPAAAAALEGLPRDRVGFLTGNLGTLIAILEDSAPQTQAFCRSLLAALSADGENWEATGLEKYAIDTNRYQAMEDRLEGLPGPLEEFFENLMVMTAFYETFPALDTPENLWRSYVELCLLYSFFRFAAVCGCGQEVGRERLFQVVGAASRGLLHNKTRRERLVDNLLKDGGTLARMAVLVGG